MIVYLVDASGNVVDAKNTDQATALPCFTGGPFKIPEIGPRISGSNTLYDGKVTNIASGGSLLGFNAGAGRPAILWKTASNATVGMWHMVDEAAVQTALASIATALGADEAAIFLNSTGTDVGS